MKKLILGLVAGFLVAPLSVVSLNAQSDNPKPTCNMCPGTYIPVDELLAYTKKAIAEKRIDQQVRDVDIGRSHVAIGMVYRCRLDVPEKDSVAEHDQVSEVYHIIDGTGTLVLGPDILGEDLPAVVERLGAVKRDGQKGVREAADEVLKKLVK